MVLIVRLRLDQVNVNEIVLPVGKRTYHTNKRKV